MPISFATNSRRIGLAALVAVLVSLSSAAEPSDSKPTSNPPPLAQQTFVVVQATGINLAPNSTFDVNQTVTLKKGQMLVLKSSSGQLIEVVGPLKGKPIDHYAPIVGNATMGYDPKSMGTHHCVDTSGAPHPSGGPNPDETAGPENSPTHCPK
ncbi:MAG TPA: hypothetical protein VMU22_12435 [Rhizomicrobium sp.]|nr:hypothetical protein [Rhizomicrobium sp.]